MFRKCRRLFPSVLNVDPTVNHQSRHAYWTYTRLQQLRLLHQNHAKIGNCPSNRYVPFAQYSNDVTHFHAIPDSNPVQESEIKAFFTDAGIQFTEGYTCFTTTCLKFVKEGMKPTKMDKLHINRTTGMWSHVVGKCTHC